MTDYDAIFIPGGHGPTADLAHNLNLGRLRIEADKSGKISAMGSAGVLVFAATLGSFNRSMQTMSS